MRFFFFFATKLPLFDSSPMDERGQLLVMGDKIKSNTDSLA